MILDFLWHIATAPAWFLAVLAGCLFVVWWAYGIRSLTAPSAWVMLALFFVWVAASNSWHWIPRPPDDPDLAVREEAWRLWAVYLRETLILAYLGAAAVSLGVMAWLVWGAYTQSVRITMLTALYAFMTFVAQAGEVMQRYVCSTNSPDLGNEHLFWAAGLRTEACGRLFGKLLGPEVGAVVGPLFFPAITVLPLLVILWRTYRRRKALKH